MKRKEKKNRSVIKAVSLLQSGCTINCIGMSTRSHWRTQSPWCECSSVPLEVEHELQKNLEKQK
jgi:hypothetical protein